MLLFTKYKCTWLTAISMSLSRSITCQDVYVQQPHVTNNKTPATVIYSEPLWVCCHGIVTQ